MRRGKNTYTDTKIKWNKENTNLTYIEEIGYHKLQ